MRGAQFMIYRKEFKRASVCHSFNEANLSSFFYGGLKAASPFVVCHHKTKAKQNPSKSNATAKSWYSSTARPERGESCCEVKTRKIAIRDSNRELRHKCNVD